MVAAPTWAVAADLAVAPRWHTAAPGLLAVAVFTRPAGPSNFGGNRGRFAANGRGRDHDHDRFRGFGFGGLYAFGGPEFYGYDNYYDDSCWQRQLVPTPYGLQWRLVDVCQ